MSQEHTLEVRDFSRTQILELEALADKALTEVEIRYGSGFPHYSGGHRGGLSYHNRYHSEAVRSGALLMSQALELPPLERALAQTAAAAHDIIQGKARGVMEQESANWLTTRLRRTGMYDEVAIRATELAILATEPRFVGGTAVSTVLELEYPTKAAENVALSVASADFSELYAANGPRLAHDIYKESQNASQAEEPDFAGVLDYQRKQVVFLEKFCFPHPLAEQLFGGLRREVIKFTASLVNRLERGEIETWQQLMAADDVFMRQSSEIN